MISLIYWAFVALDTMGLLLLFVLGLAAAGPSKTSPLAVALYLLNRKIQEGPEELEDVETVPMSSLPDTFRDVFSRSRRAADLGDEP